MSYLDGIQYMMIDTTHREAAERILEDAVEYLGRLVPELYCCMYIPGFKSVRYVVGKLILDCVYKSARTY